MTDIDAIERLKERFGGGLFLDERGKKIRQAHLYGKACGLCTRPFDDTEAVYRLRHRKDGVTLGRSHVGRHEIAPVCHECFEGYVKEWWGIKCVGVYATVECANCGRTVHETERRRFKYCCSHCRATHSAGLYSEKARKQRADIRGPSRECLVCHECFEPTRNDAKFCSPACKQKAYRAALRM